MDTPQTTLRDVLEANFDSAEPTTPPEIAAVPSTPSQPRDEVGRFAPKGKDEAPVVAQPQAAPAPQVQEDPLAKLRPTTWKKEYLPLWDKAATGQALSADEWKKLAEYNGQRENEYKTGVSTYRAEAQAAKELQEAITPFLPQLQANNLKPAAWIKQLGSAHYALAKGTPELKLQVFRELAQRYGVPLAAVMQQPGQVPNVVNELMGQISELKQQMSGVTTWRQQQEETSLTSEVQKFAQDKKTFPYFEECRGTMAQLLETGLAQDIPSAYAQAEWMVPEVREQKLLSASQQGQRQNAVQSARASAVSPKSVTPSGQVTTSGAKDRRGALEDAFDQAGGGRV